MSRIAQVILDVMKNTDESRYSMSQATGIPQSNLSRFLHGKHGLSLNNAEKLAEHLNIRITITPPPRKHRKPRKPNTRRR